MQNFTISGDDSAAQTVNNGYAVDFNGEGLVTTSVTANKVSISVATQTLETVTNAGATTINGITVGSVDTDGIRIVDNNITTTRSNDDLNLGTSGTGSIILDANVNITGTLTGGSPLDMGNDINMNSNDITAVGTLNTHTIPGGTGTLALTSDLYTNSDVDTHLNQSNPTSGFVLSWNGSDYAWVSNGIASEADSVVGAINGIVKADGAGNISAAVAETDYITASGSVTLTNKTISGGVFDTMLISQGVQEAYDAKTAATGVVVHDCDNGHIFSHSSISANFTANITNLNCDTGYATTITLVLNQGGTAYMPTAVQIAGVAQTINWEGGSAPSGTNSGIDVVSFSILNASGTYTVLGSSVSYS
jgi:hypothetical protein